MGAVLRGIQRRQLIVPVRAAGGGAGFLLGPSLVSLERALRDAR